MHAKNLDKDKFIALSDFKLGKQEKLNDAEVQAVEYVASSGADKTSIAITAWVDTKMDLPGKRQLVVV